MPLPVLGVLGGLGLRAAMAARAARIAKGARQVWGKGPGGIGPGVATLPAVGYWIYGGDGEEATADGVQQSGWGAVKNPLNWMGAPWMRNSARTLSGGWEHPRYKEHFERVTPLMPEFNRSHLSPGRERFPADSPYSTFDYVNRKRYPSVPVNDEGVDPFDPWKR